MDAADANHGRPLEASTQRARHKPFYPGTTLGFIGATAMSMSIPAFQAIPTRRRPAPAFLLLALVLAAEPTASAQSPSLVQTLLPTNAVWAYRKGTAEASSPVNAWRARGFDDSAWETGRAPFYCDAEAVYTGNTVLGDMRNNYTSLYLRRPLNVTGLADLGALQLRFFCDDGFALWINGVLVTNYNKTGANFAFNSLATGSAAEPLAWLGFTLPDASAYLVEGANQVAVQAFNASRTSSDFVFDLELLIAVRDREPPRVVEVTPAPGTVGRLDSLTVTFSEPVTGLGFSDLLVNGRPAVSLGGSGAVYTFLVDPPGEGEVRITWDPGIRVTDFASPPQAFDPAGPGATWSYQVVDRTAPAVTQVSPIPGSTVRRLDRIEVRFDEAVTGLDAGDLLADGAPAVRLEGSGAGPYVFEFDGVTPGPVDLGWIDDHGIRDLAASPNPFAGGRWSLVVDPDFVLPPLRINEFLAGTAGEAGLRDEDDELQDWIELHNRGPAAVNLAGWSLTDDPEEPGKWVFPAVNVEPGGFLVVFASAKDRRSAAPGARLHANFRLGLGGEYLGLFGPGSPRVKASELAPAYPAQRNDVSYGYDPQDRWRHFARPTPGATNGSSSIVGVVPNVDFNVSRGVFDRGFELHLSTALPDAEIRFTLDGSDPDPSRSPRFAAPLVITNTAIVRATAFAPNRLPSESVTHTYVFPAQVIRQPANPAGLPDQWIDTQGRTWTADYGMDPEIVDAPAYRGRLVDSLKALPVLSIVTRPSDMFDNNTGIYPKSQARGPSWERPASAEFIDPRAGDSVQANCGVQMQGNSVRDPVKTGKHAFRLVFKGDYGAAKLRYRVFPEAPIEEFDTLTLRADFNNSWMHWNGAQRPRGQRVRDAWMKDSQRAMGGLASHSRFFHLYVNGLYWGVYDATERPDASFAASYLGGSKEDYDVVNEGQLVDGNLTAYNAMRALSNLDRNDAYEQMKQYLDVPAYIDYVLLHFYTGHEDWFTDKNWYASRRRAPGEGFRYQSWDGELMLNSPTENIVVRTDQPSNLHPRLVANAQYRLDFADRVQRHFFGSGALTPTAAAARYDRWASLVAPAMVAESARWGDYRRDVHQYSSGPYELYTPDEHFATERNRLLTAYFPGRTATVLQQLKAAGLYPATATAPTFQPPSGRVPRGTHVTLQASAGTTYYTLDGTDPRTIYSGAVSPSARLYDGPIPIETRVVVKARTRAGNEWSALTEATFESGPLAPPLVLCEIHYHPVEGDPYEFVELRNLAGTTVDASGFHFDGIGYVFPPGSVLAPGRIIVLASDLSPTAFAAQHPGVAVFGYFSGSLANGGERLTLFDREGGIVTSVHYDDEEGWPTAADGAGPSLELSNLESDPNAPAHWRASLEPEGTPGLPPAAADAPVVRLAELMASNGGSVTNLDGTAPDWLELHNAGSAEADLGGWSIQDAGGAPGLVFPAGTRLPPDGYLVVWCDGLVDRPGWHAPFALERSGETVSLFDATGRRVDAVTYGAQVTDRTLGRLPPGDAWHLCEPTPGLPNVPQPLTDASRLSINEWIANPPGGGRDWFELFNGDPTLPVALRNLHIAAARATARLPDHSFIAPHGHLRFWADRNADPDTDLLPLALPAEGGRLSLLDDSGSVLDEIAYGPQLEGVAEGRLPDGAERVERFPLSATPGAPNLPRDYVGPVFNELMTGRPAVPTDGGWVELYNPWDQSFDLAGHALGTDSSGSVRWRFPDPTLVPARAYLIIHFNPASTASPEPGSALIAPLQLSPRGDAVRLYSASGAVVDAVAFGFQVPGQSLGWRTGFGWQLLAQPSPGEANGPAAVLGSVTDLRINEWLAVSTLGADWIEIHNRGDLPTGLWGLELTDDPSIAGSGKYVFPNLSYIGPRGFIRIQADGRPVDGPDHAGFQLSAEGESILLTSPGGAQVLDVVHFGRQTAGVSLGRFPDGADGSFRSFEVPTPESANGVIPLRPPEMAIVGWQAGALILRIHGPTGTTYRLEQSEDLTTWQTIHTETPGSLPVDWNVPVETAEAPARFYRVAVGP